MNMDDISNENENGEDTTSAKKFAARLAAIGSLAVGGGQLLPGRSRKCCFWISSIVPDGTAYIVDSNQLVQDAAWTHNPAQDIVPDDTLLVIINPRHEEHIRKAMATWRAPAGPAFVAARIIDEECRKDISLAGKLRWRVA
jgi:hypothetical protein